MTDTAGRRGYQLNRDETGLTEQERRAVLLRGTGLTVSAVGREMGVSRQRAHALLSAADAKTPPPQP